MEVGDRFLVPVKPTNKRGVGIVHDASRTGRTVYVEPAQVGKFYFHEAPGDRTPFLAHRQI